MSYETSKTVFGENATILQFAGELFQNTLVKVDAADITEVNGKKILKAGTVLTKSGKIPNGTTVPHADAFGLVYRDVDFTYSNGNENVPVTIFGFINESALTDTVHADSKTAMKMLMFL